LSVVGLLLASVEMGHAVEREGTFVVPTHPRVVFRKDDLAKLRKRCLTTHAREYALLKASSDRSAFLEIKPVTPGLLFQLTNESRYLRYAETDYDAFCEVLDPVRARALANDILYDHRHPRQNQRFHCQAGGVLPQRLDRAKDPGGYRNVDKSGTRRYRQRAAWGLGRAGSGGRLQNRGR